MKTNTTPTKCQYVGCGKQAVFTLTQTVGKKQALNCCHKCAPSWVKTGRTSQFYTVEQLPT